MNTLTKRQWECLELAAAGLTSKEVARRLALSPRTVEEHLQDAYRRMGVRNRIEASALLLQRHAAGTLGPAIAPQEL